MQMPEPTWYSFKLFSLAGQEPRAYEHQISVHLPWRRYNRNAMPQSVPGSPSVIAVGEETRHGTELSVSRISFDPYPSADVAAEMAGELAESWVGMTLDSVPRAQ